MPTGRPDYTQLVLVQGIYGTTLHTLAVDAAGRLIMVPYGATEVTGAVDVTQTDKTREIQGADGLTLRTVVVDANGQIIMVPRGQSGNYMVVDANGFLTAMMKGAHAGTPVTLAVDANGNIVAVMKGDYAGALTTLAVDSQGRMLAVLTDPEDVFGNPHYMGAAELAVRLGSIDSYDRLGNIVWMDDFEAGLAKWDLLLSGTGAAISLTTGRAHNGAYSAQLVPGSDGDRYARLYKALPYSALSAMGLELAWVLHTDMESFAISLGHRSATQTIGFGVRYLVSSAALQYRDANGSWQTIASGLGLSNDSRMFHILKVVADFQTNQFVRVFLDHSAHSLSGISGYPGTHAAGVARTVTISAYASAGTNPTCYVDDVIVTQNEE